MQILTMHPRGAEWALFPIEFWLEKARGFNRYFKIKQLLLLSQVISTLAGIEAPLQIANTTRQII